MSDSVGNVTEQHSYDSYGNSDDLTGNPFRYTGRRLDAETGLYYYRARYYSPAIGRFLQTDPIGYGDGLNWYAYVGNDPVNNTDPTGMCPWCIGFVAGMVVDIVMQTVVEGKSIGEIDVGSVLVSGVAGATGLGALKQGLNVLKAVKKVKNAKKTVQKAKKFTNNKKEQGSRKKTRNAEFREGKARENLDSTVGEAGKTVGKGVAAVGGTVALKKALPEVTVNDVTDAVKGAVDAVGEKVSGCANGDKCP